jgi:hypothetical protein
MSEPSRSKFRRTCLPFVVALGLLGASASACADNTKTHKAVPAASLEEVPGTKEKRITLTKEAAQRIALQTATVQVGAGSQTTIPYQAVFYDPAGKTWTYTSTGPLAFVRKQITVDRIEGDTAVLSQSPGSGTEVVTVGVAELYGLETGVGK